MDVGVDLPRQGCSSVHFDVARYAADAEPY